RYRVQTGSWQSQRRPGESWRDPDESAVYSVMAADSVDLRSVPGTLGEVLVQGRLVESDFLKHTVTLIPLAGKEG
ncbi:MAG: hypothetical protein ACK2T2_05600, partial [Anaerolineales bacterium]